MSEREWYCDVDVVVDGALDASETFDDPTAADAWIEEQKRAALEANDGLRTEIYVLEHGHAPPEDGECSCAQYLTDHHPAWSHTPAQPRKDGGE